MTTYNMSFMEGNATIDTVLQGLNAGVDNTLGSAIMITVMIIIMITLMNKGFENALIVSSFVGAVLAGLFAALGIMAAYLMFLPVGILLVGIITKQVSNND